NNLLNPTHGQTIIYRAQPFKNTINSSKYFFKQTLIYNLYIPLEKNRNFILAIRMTLGSIFGANVFDLPLTKLFLGGSDDDLRGYKYRTVSPLDSNNDPIGGRSAIYFTFEPRIRLTEKIGLVPFTDLGVVSFKEHPSVNEKWFKSVGIGLRYFSFFGPIRLDVAFPLDRRRAIDPRYKIYVSVGQTF
nr:Translocation and assembly module TamA [Candidatus Anoxychlamydiales bacterium]